MFGRIRVTLAIASAGVLMFGAGTAQAALSGPGGALHGCVDRHGALQVIAFKSRCARGRQSVKFGAQGAAGAPADPSTISALQTQVNTLKQTASTLQGQNTTLTNELSALNGTLAGVTRTGTTLRFSGMNLQVESGAGSTTGPLNGLGNLIIGYDELARAQTGSHNLILGRGQSFTSYGGILAGTNNTISAPGASVTGGDHNTSSGSDTSVSGGFTNTASGIDASVAGGQNNVAGDTVSSVLGGCDNLAGPGAALTANCSAGVEAILGGTSNRASGDSPTVSGGENNDATGFNASILGGSLRTAISGCQAVPASVGTC
jgi:hypothetical protein